MKSGCLTGLTTQQIIDFVQKRLPNTAVHENETYFVVRFFDPYVVCRIPKDTTLLDWELLATDIIFQANVRDEHYMKHYIDLIRKGD